MTLRHFLRFNVTSLVGLAVQLATLWLLIHGCGLHYLVATILGVAAAVVHNFVWHWRWTWADRRLAPRRLLAAFWRFAIANGAVSLAGNVLMMPMLVGGFGLPPVPANVTAVAICGLINFSLADRVVFPTPDPAAGGIAGLPEIRRGALEGAGRCVPDAVRGGERCTERFRFSSHSLWRLRCPPPGRSGPCRSTN